MLSLYLQDVATVAILMYVHSSQPFGSRSRILTISPVFPEQTSQHPPLVVVTAHKPALTSPAGAAQVSRRFHGRHYHWRRCRSWILGFRDTHPQWRSQYLLGTERRCQTGYGWFIGFVGHLGRGGSRERCRRGAWYVPPSIVRQRPRC